ncbi:MAG: PQQ-binding-like beta-propeller repeat protein [Anaerolineales bacterium]|jgi:outer membrane protein assembly factor BamB
MFKLVWKIISYALLIMLFVSACKPTTQPAQVPNSTSKAGTILWTYATQGEVWSSPTIAKGVVYFGSDDKSVYAVDTTTHQARWKFITGGIVRSRPAVSGKMVYVASDDGTLYALDASSGKEKWKADLDSAKIPARGDLSHGYDYLQSSPAVADGIVYVGSGAGEVDAFDALTGQRIWQFMTTSRVRSSPTVVDGTVFIGDGNGNLYALNAKSGTELWKAEGCDNPTPAIADGLVYCGSRAYWEQAWDTKTGQKRWMFSFGDSWVESSARVVDGVLYVGSSDLADLFALDSATGNLKWKFNVRGFAWCSPAIANGVVYIGAYDYGTDAGFFAVDAKTGQQKWMLYVHKGIVSSPTIVAGVVYFGSLDGNLYAVKAD